MAAPAHESLTTGKNDGKSPSIVDTEHEAADPSGPVRISFFRSTLFQILVVGLCAFCAPGIWSAM